MPMNRYEIRNEYSLADPELYRAADKDDPEALLEGVAMAGLVGVLRQLGDLADFAAEIFHDLHEEVMATAARGHGLMIRVQQLETEVPSIEKAFLSQTDHSSVFYSAGVDWHPNLRIEQNLVTQGDLPRFVMDSYEECRGPPRLFLLDKFDVAGAGACLKRYTDPSFFKVETSTMTSADVQREKKFRKAKKKGPRWRNRETPELLPMSYAKLHQLFLEEPVENGVGNPARRAKLKRRLNGFPFHSKTGKSYMEKLLKTPSPEHKMLHEITTSSPLRLPTNDHNESDLEVLDVGSVSPAREFVRGKRSPPSPDREGIMPTLFMNETREVSTDDKICEEPNSYLNTVTEGITSTLDEEAGEKDITLAGESKTEGSFTGYQSDEIASEIDNYVDATSTMESEMDTDSEWRVKNDFSPSYVKSQPLISVEKEGHIQCQSSDSQSTGDLTISDEGNNSSKKEMSSFLSDSPRTSTENLQSEKMSAEGFPSADVPEISIVDASSNKKTADKDFPVDQLPKPGNTCTGKDALTEDRPDFEQLTSTFCSTDSTPILLHYDSEGVVRTDGLREPISHGTASTSDDDEKKTNLITYSQCSPSVSDSKSKSGYDSPRSSSGDHLVDEPNGENAPCISTVSDTIHHTTDSSAGISAYLLHEDDFYREDLNQFENTNSTPNMCNVLSQGRTDTVEMISTETPIPGKLDDDVPKSPENFLSEYTDIAHNGDNITSIASKADKLNDKLDVEDSNVIYDASNHFSCIMEASLGKDLMETSLTDVETVDTEDQYATSSIHNRISSETFILSVTENSPDWPQVGLDSHERDVITEEESTVIETPEPGSLKSCEVVGLQGAGATDDVMQNDFVAPESSCYTSEKLEDATGMSDTTQNASLGKDLKETSLANAEIVETKDQYANSSIDNQISSETLILLVMENSLDWPQVGLDAHERDVITEEESTVIETPEPGSPKSCEVVGLQGAGATDDVMQNDFVAPGSSCFTPEKLEDATGMSDTTQNASVGKDLVETSLTDVETVDTEDQYASSSIHNRICSETFISSVIENSPDWPQVGLDAHERDVIPEEERTVNKTPELGTPKTCEVVGLQGAGATNDIMQNDCVAPESSCYTPEKLDDATGMSDTTQNTSVGKDLVETSLTDVETVDTEDQYANSSIHNRICSETFILSVIENSPDWSQVGLDAHERDVIPEEERTVNKTPELGTPQTCEVVGLQGAGATDDGMQNDCVALESSCYTPEKFEDATGMSDTSGKDGINPYSCATGLEVTEISSSADLKSLDEVHVLFDESDPKTDQSETALMASSGTAVSDKAIGDSISSLVGLNKLFEEHIPCFEDSGLDELENDKNSLPGNRRESGLEENKNYFSGSHGESGFVGEVDEREAVALDLHRVFCSTINNDPESEVSHTVPNSYLDSKFDQSLEFVDAIQVQSPLEQSGLATDQESLQQSGVENKVSDATVLPVDCDTEETTLSEKIQLPPDWADQELAESGEISSELSSLLPINHHQMLDHDDHKGDNNRASLFSLANRPPSVSELPGLRNCDINVSGSPKDPLGFIFPPSNFLSGTNQINLDELPPLPPLPPVQWRMGKLRHASSTTEEDTLKQKEFFLREIFPPTVSTGDVSPSLEEANQPLIQIVPEITSKEERVEHSFSSLKVKSMHETTDFPPKIENEQQQFVMPPSESEVISPPEEDGVGNGSRKVKLPRPRNPLIDDVVSLDKSKLRKVTEQVRPQMQKVDERDSLLEQIRTKSFNLKPAVALRPSIQGPKTNLQVAAILEKAHAIRQALADSDEDDEDNWSDS